MNNLRSISINLILLFFSLASIAQKDFEGKVVYESSSENGSANRTFSTSTYYFKKNKVRMEVTETNASYAIKSIFITDYVKGDFITITKMTALAKGLKDFESAIVKKIDPDITRTDSPITYLDEYKMILGYKCQKVTYKIYSPLALSELEITAYVNRDYVSADLNAQPGRHINPFLTLDNSAIIKRLENLTLNAKAISVSEEPISDDVFDPSLIPAENSANSITETSSANKSHPLDRIMISPQSQAKFVTTNKECLVYINSPKEKEIPKWTGGCKDGYADGEGKLEYKFGENGKAVFEGVLINGKKEGLGKIKGESNYKSFTYEGNYKWNLPEGYGTWVGSFGGSAGSLVRRKGSTEGKYIGMYKSGTFEGVGSLYNGKNELAAKGFWFEDDYSGIQFWTKDEFTTDTLYRNYDHISVVKLDKVKGFRVVFDTILKTNISMYYGQVPLNADFSENSTLLYAKIFGKTMILNCETGMLEKTNICSLEESYSPLYKFQLEKNRCYNAAHYNSTRYGIGLGWIIRDYASVNSKTVVAKAYKEDLGDADRSNYVSGVEFEEYSTGQKLSKFILNPNPEQFKKEQEERERESDELLMGVKQGLESGSSDELYKSIGTLIGSKIIQSINEKPGENYLRAFAINPKYNYIVTSHVNYHEILIWATDKTDKTKIYNNAPAIILKQGDYSANQLCFDPSGNYLIVREEASELELSKFAKGTPLPGTSIWDMSNRKKIASFPNYHAQSFSKTGHYLILGSKHSAGPQILVVELSSGKVVYEYKDEYFPKMGVGSVTSAYFSPDGKKIGIASLYRNVISDSKGVIPSFTVIYPDFDFSPKISDVSKANYLQSAIPFVINKNALPVLFPFAEVLAQKLKNTPKPEPKSEFETVAEYTARTEKHYLPSKAIVQKYWEMGAGFYNETVNKKEMFTCKPSSVVKYDAEKMEYTISVSGYEAKIKIPAAEAKTLKETGLNGYVVSGEKVLNVKTNLYDYKNVTLKNAETGKMYSGNFAGSFSSFITN